MSVPDLTDRSGGFLTVGEPSLAAGSFWDDTLLPSGAHPMRVHLTNLGRKLNPAEMERLG